MAGKEMAGEGTAGRTRSREKEEVEALISNYCNYFMASHPLPIPTPAL